MTVPLWKAVTATAVAFVAGGIAMLTTNGDLIVTYLALKLFCE